MRHQGNYVIVGNLEPRTTQPLDSRLVIDTSKALTDEATWKSGDGTIYVYQGMVVSTSDATPEVWKLKKYVQGSADYKDISNWVRIDGSEDYIAWLFNHNSKKIADAYIIDNIGTVYPKGGGDPSKALSHARGIELRDAINDTSAWLTQYIKDSSVYEASTWDTINAYNTSFYKEFSGYVKDISTKTTAYNTSTWETLNAYNTSTAQDISKKYTEFQNYAKDISTKTTAYNTSFYTEFSEYVRDISTKTTAYNTSFYKEFSNYVKDISVYTDEYNTSTWDTINAYNTSYYKEFSNYVKDISTKTTAYNTSSYKEFTDYVKDISIKTSDYNTSAWLGLHNFDLSAYKEFQDYSKDISTKTTAYNTSSYKEFSEYVKDISIYTEEYRKLAKDTFDAHCEAQSNYNTSSYERFADLSTNFTNLKDKIQTALVYRGSVNKYGDLYNLPNVSVGDMWNVYSPVTFAEIKDHFTTDDLFNIPNANDLLDTSVVYTSGTNFAYNPRGKWDAQGGSADGLDTLISENRKNINIIYENVYNLSTNLMAGKAYTIRWKKSNNSY